MKRYLSIAAIAALLAAPPSVAAQETDPMTVDIGSYRLVARVVVDVEVGFTCQPKADVEYPWDSHWGSMGGMESQIIRVQVRQAVGRHLQASGEVTWYFDADELCTGEQQAIGLSVVPDPSGPPFKTGTAAINVSGSASYDVVNQSNWQESYDVPQRDSTGWLQIRLGK